MPPTGEYSVLMSVYAKENAGFLRAAMDSMFQQTLPSDDFVLVCDGPLTPELDGVVQEMLEKHPNALHVLRLEKNGGLGNALNHGLAHCRHDLVARMDSDDISFPDRCEKQTAQFRRNPHLSIVSGTVQEFQTIPSIITGQRKLPEKNDAIVRFSKRRCPFNHPAVMFRKQAVDAAGGYNEKYHLFEDYSLWVRMLANGCEAYNLPDPILWMRVPPDLYRRRGGIAYTKSMLRLFSWMVKIGWSSPLVFLVNAVPRAVIYCLPNALRGIVYRLLHKT